MRWNLRHFTSFYWEEAWVVSKGPYGCSRAALNKKAPLCKGSSREAGEGSFPWSFLAGTNSVREICRTYESPSLGVGFLRFKGLIWHSPEVYFRFKGLLPK